MMIDKSICFLQIPYQIEEITPLVFIIQNVSVEFTAKGHCKEPYCIVH